MIRSQKNSFTGDTEYQKCTECGAVWNYEIDECPSCRQDALKRHINRKFASFVLSLSQEEHDVLLENNAQLPGIIKSLHKIK